MRPVTSRTIPARSNLGVRRESPLEAPVLHIPNPVLLHPGPVSVESLSYRDEHNHLDGYQFLIYNDKLN